MCPHPTPCAPLQKPAPLDREEAGPNARPGWACTRPGVSVCLVLESSQMVSLCRLPSGPAFPTPCFRSRPTRGVPGAAAHAFRSGTAFRVRICIHFCPFPGRDVRGLRQSGSVLLRTGLRSRVTICSLLWAPLAPPRCKKSKFCSLSSVFSCRSVILFFSPMSCPSQCLTTHFEAPAGGTAAVAGRCWAARHCCARPGRAQVTTPHSTSLPTSLLATVSVCAS